MARIVPVTVTVSSTRASDFELTVRYAFHLACRQAFDQVKAAIKNGNLPNDKHIQWVVAVGPYFIIKGCGPFTLADLETRSHCPNPSGDSDITEFLSILHFAQDVGKFEHLLSTSPEKIPECSAMRGGCHMTHHSDASLPPTEGNRFPYLSYHFTLAAG